MDLLKTNNKLTSLTNLFIIFFGLVCSSSCIKSDTNTKSPGLTNHQELIEPVVSDIKLQCKSGACPTYLAIIPSSSSVSQTNKMNTSSCLGHYISDRLVATHIDCLPEGTLNQGREDKCPWDYIYGISTQNQLVQRKCLKIYESSALNGAENKQDLSNNIVLLEVSTTADMDFLYDPHQGTKHNYATTYFHLAQRSSNEWSLVSINSRSIPFSTYFPKYDGQFSPMAYVKNTEFAPSKGSPIMQNGVITGMADDQVISSGGQNSVFPVFNYSCVKKTSFPELFSSRECRTSNQPLLQDRVINSKIHALYQLTTSDQQYNYLWSDLVHPLRASLWANTNNPDYYVVAPWCYESVGHVYQFIKKALGIKRIKHKQKYVIPNFALQTLEAKEELSIGRTTMKLENVIETKSEIVIDMIEANEDNEFLNTIPVSIKLDGEDNSRPLQYSLIPCPQDPELFMPIKSE
jgi:hypothetical protein